MTASLLRIARAGYAASRSGALLAANPWPVETLGGHWWSLGWHVGDLPPVVRFLVAAVML
jgi:hypothetical protein